MYVSCVRKVGRRGRKRYVLGSVGKNWFAMLRSVKSVPGRAEKMVPSETRLSEQPINMNGGAGEAKGHFVINMRDRSQVEAKRVGLILGC